MCNKKKLLVLKKIYFIILEKKWDTKIKKQKAFCWTDNVRQNFTLTISWNKFTANKLVGLSSKYQTKKKKISLEQKKS